MASDKLTVAERGTLAMLEKRIADARTDLESAVTDIGSALIEIHDDKLYREQSATFEEYCIQHWGFTHSYARRLIYSAEINAELALEDLAPIPERQARALKRAPEDQRAGIIKKVRAQGEAQGRAITVKDIEAEVARVPDSFNREEVRKKVLKNLKKLLEQFPVKEQQDFFRETVLDFLDSELGPE